MRTIDADALMEQMKRRKEFVGRPSDPVCLVEDAPTIEAKPVKHGHWIDKPTGKYGNWQSYCSACGKHSQIGGIESNRHKPRCPWCGAFMDEVSE